MKLESSPLAGMPEVDPLAMVASGPEEVPLAAPALPELLPEASPKP